MDSACQNFNRPGALQQVQFLDVRQVKGFSISSAHLIFTARDSRRCAVYAAIAVPSGPGPHPIVIHAPGGGQTVADEDIFFWVRQGFACVAFDWQVGLFDHDPQRKSVWPAGVVLQSEPFVSWSQFIIPLAVEAVGVVIDWASTFPGLETRNIGMTGISWGGYLTWIANAYEPRLKCTAPVYGCGGLFKEGRPGGPPQVSDELAKRWCADWDPISLGRRQLSPVCWISATNDFFGFPQDADELMAGMELPHRRSHSPNLNHAVLPEDSATVVAWMRHYLAGGPALPNEPQWMPRGLWVDQCEEVESIEEWWTPSTGRTEDFCWWPGTAPAAATAKLARVRYRRGLALTTPIEKLNPVGSVLDMGDLWTDARAGIGCCSLSGATQLHGNSVRLEGLSGDSTRARVMTTDDKPSALIVLRQFSDPRFNCLGFAGLRMRLSRIDRLPEKLTVMVLTCNVEGGSQRSELRGQVNVGGNGQVELSRHTLHFLPQGFSWSRVCSVWLDGFPDPPFEIGPIVRFRE